MRLYTRDLHNQKSKLMYKNIIICIIKKPRDFLTIIINYNKSFV